MPPKDTIFLHIGMHKTATTSIQQALRGFSDGTTRYARLGSPNHSIALLNAFGGARTTARHDARKGVSGADRRAQGELARQQLRAELKSAERNLVLSGEGLTRLNKAGIVRLHRVLNRFAERVQVLAYIRDPNGFASSSFQQQLKGGQSKFMVPIPNYRRRFAGFEDVFGPEAMTYARFAPGALQDGCIITDFCTRVGIDAQALRRDRLNESMAPEVAGMFLLWNSNGIKSLGAPEHAQARNRLTSLLGAHFRGKFRFDPELVAQQVDAADCAWMEERAGFALRPATEAPSDGIRTREHLVQMAESAMPRLREVLAEQGLPDNADTPTEALNRLYRKILENRPEPV